MIDTVIGCVLAAIASAALFALAAACRPVSGRHAAPRRAALLVWQETPAVPAPRRPVNGRYLGTQPRRTPYPSAADPMTPVETCDAPPWSIATAQQPALDEPAYGVDRCEADVDEARRRYPCCVHCEGFTCDQPDHPAPCGEDGCQVDAAEAERHYALALGPDGCEET